MSTELFFLRTAPHPSSPDATRFSQRFVRHHGGGINAVMIMPEPPKFLRFQIDQGRVTATSWKNEHRERSFGLVLDDEKEVGGWSAARIVEGKADAGFVFRSVDGDHESRTQLVRDTGTDSTLAFDGWAVCEWAHGHPQLFWLTDKHRYRPLPPFLERIVLEKVPIYGQPAS